MTQKRLLPEESISKSHEADALRGVWQMIDKIVRRLTINEHTYYRWSNQHGDMTWPDAERLKGVKRENVWLKSAISELTLDKQICRSG